MQAGKEILYTAVECHICAGNTLKCFHATAATTIEIADEYFPTLTCSPTVQTRTTSRCDPREPGLSTRLSRRS